MSTTTTVRSLRMAVVGGGIGGLAAAGVPAPHRFRERHRARSNTRPWGDRYAQRKRDTKLAELDPLSHQASVYEHDAERTV